MAVCSPISVPEGKHERKLGALERVMGVNAKGVDRIYKRDLYQSQDTPGKRRRKRNAMDLRVGGS